MPIHTGLKRFFDPLVRMSKLAGPQQPNERIDSTGFYGDVNYEFTGDEGWTWYVTISPAGVSFHRGGSYEPRATISMAPDTFFKMLRGDTSPTVAQMTGRVRIRGDGYAGLMIGAVVKQFRTPPKQPGLQGWLTKLWRKRVLDAIGGD